MGIVSAYQQADEPPDLSAGTTWYRDNGTWAIRKDDLTWNEMGNWTQPNHGHLPVAGGTMLGPILGEHGLATLDSPPFTGTPTIDGDEIATKAWVTEELEALQTEMNNFVSASFGGTEGTITIGNNMAIAKGVVSNGGTIPLPVYSDSDTASLDEVWGVIVSPRYVQGHSDATSTFDWAINCYVNDSLVVTCNFQGWASTTATVNYLIICKR